MPGPGTAYPPKGWSAPPLLGDFAVRPDHNSAPEGRSRTPPNRLSPALSGSARHRDTIIEVVPRTNTEEVKRHKAYGRTGRSAWKVSSII